MQKRRKETFSNDLRSVWTELTPSSVVQPLARSRLLSYLLPSTALLFSLVLSLIPHLLESFHLIILQNSSSFFPIASPPLAPECKDGCLFSGNAKAEVCVRVSVDDVIATLFIDY